VALDAKRAVEEEIRPLLFKASLTDDPLGRNKKYRLPEWFRSNGGNEFGSPSTKQKYY